MHTRHVVTSFLENEGRVLLLRRSQRVSTYRGCWAGVSGGVREEGTPLAQALREIDEETGLGRDDIELVADADPEIFEAAELDTRWVVHPFLFHTDVPERVRLDWEHDDCRWLDPDALAELETVPRLAEVLRRVDPRVYRDTARDRARLAITGDRERGASALAGDAVRHLLRLVVYGGHPDADALEEDLRAEAARTAALRPTMVAIEAAALAIADRVVVGRGQGADLEALRHDVREFAAGRAARLSGAGARIARDLEPWLADGGRVATLSHSGVVADVLLAWGGRLGGVLVCESRPGQEGRALARRLAKAGIPVTLLPDGAVVAAARQAHLCLVGADAVAADGGVVNKTGSHALALAARALARPFLVATTTDRVDPLAPRRPERQPAEDLWDDPPVGVRVENVPFEHVPAPLIRAILTEEGRLTADDLANRASRARALRNRHLP